MLGAGGGNGGNGSGAGPQSWHAEVFEFLGQEFHRVFGDFAASKAEGVGHTLQGSAGKPSAAAAAAAAAGPMEQTIMRALAALVVCLLVLTIVRRRRTPVKALVVLGSGGHTTEMLSMLTALPEETLPERVFMIASTDANSEGRLLAAYPRARIVRTPRAREVGQSWTSSVVTTLIALVYAVAVVFRESPDAILCNGPGTCVPVAYAAKAMQLVYLKKCFVAFTESIARVDHLSLSGKLLYPIADRFMVQWEPLAKRYKRSRYVGFVI